MKFLNTIIAMTIIGVTLAISEDPKKISERELEKVDWWLQWSHPDSLRNISEARGWTHLKWNENKIAVLIGMDQTDGESNIPVSVYVYNEAFKEWRRFMNLNTRNAFHLRATIDEERKTIDIVGGEHSPLKGVIIASYSLTAISDDRSYAKTESGTEQDGARHPATAVDSKSEGKKKPKLESKGHSQ